MDRLHYVMVTNNPLPLKFQWLLTTEVYVLYMLCVSHDSTRASVVISLQAVEAATILNVAHGSGNGKETVQEIVTSF